MAVDDPARLAAVEGTGLVGGVPVETLDHLTDLAARLLEAPLAFLTMVDADESHWVSCSGLGDGDPRENTVEESFCQYVIADRAPLVIDDAAAHPRTRHNPSIAGMGVRAWAGFPVMDGDGHALGSFCVVDTVPRSWAPEQVETLRVLAVAASAQVQLLTRERVATTAREISIRLASADHALSRMADLALRLGSVVTLKGLVEVVVDVGLPALGADGGALALRDAEAGVVRLLVADRLGQRAKEAYPTIPLDSPLPAVHTAVTGERVLLPDRASGLAFTDQMEAAYDSTDRSAWAFAPLRVADDLLGSLAASWRDEHVCTPGEVRLLDAIASLCAQTVSRLQRRDEQQAILQTVRRMSETLQRSLLTQPDLQSHLSVAVRYAPASQHAQVGGDWHDAFVTTAGRLTLVVGDVSGHDQLAAAAMGQARNLLRGLAYDSRDGPARIITRLDAALLGLQLATYATVVLVQVDEVSAGASATTDSAPRLRWSSAGHLPPMLRLPDGTVRVLDDEPDLMLGVDPASERTDRSAALVDGATLLLYTDGLIERRGEPMERSLDSLARTFGAVGGQHPEDVCDDIVRLVAGEDHEDDVAVLVMRVDAGGT